jgi:hypothetical protein
MPDNANPNSPAGSPLNTAGTTSGAGQPKAGKPAISEPTVKEPNRGHIPITEELDSAKWTLPPVLPLLAGLVVVVVGLVIVFLTNPHKPSASLAINKVASADQEGNTMVALQVKIDNQIDTPLWIQNITAEVETSDGKKYKDNSAPGVDAPRYMQAFPALEEAKTEKGDWLKEELKIPSKTAFTGVAIFSYPVAKTAFDARKSLTLRIQMYDHPPLVVTEAAKP